MPDALPWWATRSPACAAAKILLGVGFFPANSSRPAASAEPKEELVPTPFKFHAGRNLTVQDGIFPAPNISLATAQ
ncbi:Uncharacterised protein [uncultured archaeon]|nr:Uncharacterised protein [uncultured archaeon]